MAISSRLRTTNVPTRSAGRAREATVDTGALDHVLTGLADHRTVWARLPIKDKIQYLTEVRQATLANAERWADAETKAKQLRVGSPLVGAEAWLSGPYGVAAWTSAKMRRSRAKAAALGPAEKSAVTGVGAPS